MHAGVTRLDACMQLDPFGFEDENTKPFSVKHLSVLEKVPFIWEDLKLQSMS